MSPEEMVRLLSGWCWDLMAPLIKIWAGMWFIALLFNYYVIGC